MAILDHKNIMIFSFFYNYVIIIIISNMMIGEVDCSGAIYTPPNVEKVSDMFNRIPSVNGVYNVFFGNSNVLFTNNGSIADLTLDKISGSGLVSKNKYYYGFFNAAMKLPPGFTSGIVIAFYMSNADVYPKNHDEIDFELLGHEKRRDWILQTNLYGNGSVRTGREEKFYLWFDPTEDFHDYSILWNNHHIVFMVDNIPVREVIHNTAINPIYPSSRPMSLYITIWDGSQWATHGGKYPVNYEYAPFVTSVRGIELEGCRIMSQQQKDGSSKSEECSSVKNTSLDPVDGEEFGKLSDKQKIGLEWARRKHMFYSYCQDKSRYKVMPPECNIAS